MEELTVEVPGQDLLKQGVARMFGSVKGVAVVPRAGEVLVLVGDAWPAYLAERRTKPGSEFPGAGLAVLALRADDLLEGIRLGVSAYLAIGEPPEVLIQGLQAAARREPFYSPLLAATIWQALQRGALSPDCQASLTRCEEKVAALAAQGLTNAEIAEQMSVSIPTVKTHLVGVFRKLQVTHRYELPDILSRRQTPLPVCPLYPECAKTATPAARSPAMLQVGERREKWLRKA